MSICYISITGGKEEQKTQQVMLTRNKTHVLGFFCVGGKFLFKIILLSSLRFQ